jgi:hypothetical protein
VLAKEVAMTEQDKEHEDEAIESETATPLPERDAMSLISGPGTLQPFDGPLPPEPAPVSPDPGQMEPPPGFKI